MAARGKSINVFLMDGDPTGRIKCTLANWTGVAYKIPRNELDKCKERDDLSQSGVYFLFGANEEDREAPPKVYIGQAGLRKNGEGILCRLIEHKRDQDKDFWNEAVVFTTSNDSFGQTEISYLESRFTNMAIEAKRYTVTNGNDPSKGHTTEEKESELEEFIDYAKIIMGTLGYMVFESLLPSSTSVAGVEAAQSAKIFYIKRSGANASAQMTNEGIVVLPGSLIRKDLVPSCPDYVKSIRKAYKDFIDENGAMQRGFLFKTPSGAASFVLGAPTNGNIEWKTEDGKTLKDAVSGE